MGSAEILVSFARGSGAFGVSFRQGRVVGIAGSFGPDTYALLLEEATKVVAEVAPDREGLLVVSPFGLGVILKREVEA